MSRRRATTRPNTRIERGAVGPRHGFTGQGDLEASLVMIAPLMFAYAIGVLFAGRVNGADVVTRALYATLGRTTYLLVYAVAAMLFLVWIRRGQRWGVLRIETVAPVVLEAAIYAFTLGTVINLVLDRCLGLGIDGNSLVSAIGAGVHEEVVFRLALCGVIVSLASGSGRFAVVLAFIVSSLAFAAAHHVGVYGEPFTLHVFAFRTLAGVAFAAIFWFRSLAHAVYAHAIYDLAVAAS